MFFLHLLKPHYLVPDSRDVSSLRWPGVFVGVPSEVISELQGFRAQAHFVLGT